MCDMLISRVTKREKVGIIRDNLSHESRTYLKSLLQLNGNFWPWPFFSTKGKIANATFLISTMLVPAIFPTACLTPSLNLHLFAYEKCKLELRNKEHTHLIKSAKLNLIKIHQIRNKQTDSEEVFSCSSHTVVIFCNLQFFYACNY
ncbi:hypothetical protein CLIB1423_06S03180 [[Candida] railenensis]|uniref:Uncharacterized protein n=1 Tax=[Candida] railenensis TaxID=45579 RepID=A0A9P0QP27_9ASCO|nr:hypothetical protein CLIB1423_06S03180 [[Candida] railenensis]